MQRSSCPIVSLLICSVIVLILLSNLKGIVFLGFVALVVAILNK